MSHRGLGTRSKTTLKSSREQSPLFLTIQGSIRYEVHSWGSGSIERTRNPRSREFIGRGNDRGIVGLATIPSFDNLGRTDAKRIVDALLPQKLVRRQIPEKVTSRSILNQLQWTMAILIAGIVAFQLATGPF
jgi:hypothetical protein